MNVLPCDICKEYNQNEELLICDACLNEFHLDCLKLPDVPKGV
jgi:hypothetical protein